MAELTENSVSLAHPEVFNGVRVSYGIAPILNALTKLSTSHNRPLWDLFLINVETLIRDRKSDNTNVKATAISVLEDCSVLAQYIAAYCRYTLPRGRSVNVCFYLPKYENIPMEYKRDKLPKGTEERWAVRDEIDKLIMTNGYQNHYDATKVLFIKQSSKAPWAHVSLMSDLTANIGVVGMRNTLMISHVPLDFHLGKVIKSFSILESYTGAIKTMKDFGKKVFQNEDIPFNKYTHLLLGDKWYVKNQLSTSGKRVVKEAAKKDHWSILPLRVVFDKILNLRLVGKELLTKPEI